MGRDHHFAKVLFVLDPVQLDLEAGKLGLLDVAFLQQRVDGSNDVLGAGGRRLALEVIEFDNHISCEERINFMHAKLATLQVQTARWLGHFISFRA